MNHSQPGENGQMNFGGVNLQKNYILFIYSVQVTLNNADVLLEMWLSQNIHYSDSSKFDYMVMLRKSEHVGKGWEKIDVLFKVIVNIVCMKPDHWLTVAGLNLKYTQLIIVFPLLTMGFLQL